MVLRNIVKICLFTTSSKMSDNSKSLFQPLVWLTIRIFVLSLSHHLITSRHTASAVIFEIKPSYLCLYDWFQNHTSPLVPKELCELAHLGSTAPTPQVLSIQLLSNACFNHHFEINIMTDQFMNEFLLLKRKKDFLENCFFHLWCEWSFWSLWFLYQML